MTIGNSVTTIENATFRSCSSLISVTIGNSVKRIDNYAFEGCTELKNVTIPDSVTSIGYSAFDNCSNLKEVFYKGTASEWKNIDIDSRNSYLYNAKHYYYSESQPTESGNYWHYVDGKIVIW